MKKKHPNPEPGRIGEDPVDLPLPGEEQFRDEVADACDDHPRGEGLGDDCVAKCPLHDSPRGLHGKPHKDREQRPEDAEDDRGRECRRGSVR